METNKIYNELLPKALKHLHSGKISHKQACKLIPIPSMSNDDIILYYIEFLEDQLEMYNKK